MKPKLELLEQIRLVKGKQDDPHAMCVMQAVDYVTTGGFSDTPECASRTITSFCIALNDSMTDEERQRLKDYVPKIIGTKDGYATEDKLGQLVIDWNFRTAIPALMRFANLEEEARKLESLNEVTRENSEEAKTQMAASEAASRAASGAASRAASGAASRAAWWAAWWAASEAASRAASRAASWAAWWAASEAASRAASEAASGAASELKERFAKVRPIIIDSALELLDRMVSVAKGGKA